MQIKSIAWTQQRRIGQSADTHFRKVDSRTAKEGGSSFRAALLNTSGQRRLLYYLYRATAAQQVVDYHNHRSYQQKMD
ncbi:hypothetical protein ACVWYO_003200 [Sphingomonas sp. UYP23]